MIKAEVVKDSVSVGGVRLTTFVLTYPRFIHSEFMTHRMLSRNASSSRAIPVSKFMDAIKNEPAMPLAFTKNCKGMQAKETLDSQDEAVKVWLEARDSMLDFVQKLSDLGVHKQHANRLLEPFQHITVVASATDWANFFALRFHKDAQPEFRELAKLMYQEISKSTPKKLINGDWHLPFIPDLWDFRTETIESCNKTPVELTNGLTITDLLIRRSVARCARVSYNNHDGTEDSLQKDLELYNRLVSGAPMHASPTEHQAMSVPDQNIRSGNFKGWIQYRKTLCSENILEFYGPSES